MKHTKGPWFQSHSKCSDGMYRTKVYNKDVTICTLDWAGEKTSETTTTSRRGENALLISKAPEMYEALKEIAERKGIYSCDKLIWAQNTIKSMAEIAEKIIKELES